MGSSPFFELAGSAFQSDSKGSSYTGLRFHINTTTGHYTANSSSLLDDNWHVVVGTYNGQNISLYLDGALLSSQNASGVLNLQSLPVYLGVIGGSSSALSATVNNVQVYSRALSDSQIALLSLMM